MNSKSILLLLVSLMLISHYLTALQCYTTEVSKDVATVSSKTYTKDDRKTVCMRYTFKCKSNFWDVCTSKEGAQQTIKTIYEAGSDKTSCDYYMINHGATNMLCCSTDNCNTLLANGGQSNGRVMFWLSGFVVLIVLNLMSK